MTTSEPGPESALERAFAVIVDHANRGEPLGEDAIRARWPEIADELLDAVRDFDELADPGTTARRLGHFVLRREIGRGGMGVVYEASDETLDRIVALKVLPAGRAIDEKSVARFRREARIAARLRHPNVVTVHGTGVVDETPYIAMELVEGEGLEALLATRRRADEDSRLYDSRALTGIKRAFSASSATIDVPPTPSASDVTGPISAAPQIVDGKEPGPAPRVRPSARSRRSTAIPDAARCDLGYCLRMAGLFAEVAEGLDYAHEQGIIHRDIKPSNLILEHGNESGAERLRILDFGLARLEGKTDLTRSSEIVGTPRYMSPEQVHGTAESLSRASDIFSLGATLFETLCLSPPFDGRSAAEILSRVATGEPRSLRRLNPRVPRDLETVILKCLEKRPESRYRSAGALAQDLRRVVKGDPIEARPQRLAERVARRIWRHRGKAALGLAATALVALTVWLAASRRDESLRRRVTEHERKTAEAVALLELGEVMTSVLEVAESPLGFDMQRTVRGLSDERDFDPVQRALRILDPLVREMPDRADAHYQRGRALALLESMPEAEQSFEKAVELGDPRAMVRLAEIRRDRGEESAAAPLLDEARRLSGAEWVDTWLAAREAQRGSRWDVAAERWEALARIERSLDDSGGAREMGRATLSVEAFLACAVANLRLENLEVARRHFTLVSGMRPQAIEPELLVTFVDYLSARRRKDAAAYETALRRFETITQDNVDAIGWVVVLLFGHGEDPERVLAWARRLPDGLDRDLWEASCLAMLSRPAEALEAVERLEAHESTVGLASMIAAITYLNLGKFSEAAARAERAAELSPESSFPLQILGSALSLQGEYRRGMAAYVRGTELEPQSPSAWFYLGMSLHMARQSAAAIGPLTRSTQLGRANSPGVGLYSHEMAYLLLGASQQAVGAHEAAIEAFESGLALCAERGDVEDPQWPILLARSLEVVGRNADALAHAEKACAHPLTHGAFGADAREELARAAHAALPDLVTYASVDAALTSAMEDVTIPIGAEWRFWRGSRAPPGPALAWTTLDHDDASWEQGASGFGYGDEDDATVLDDMEGHFTSVFLRRTFELTEEETSASFRLRVRADDGFIAFLDGTEIARVNVAADVEIDSRSTATRQANEPLETIEIPLPANALPPGRHVLALLGLNSSASSSDFSLLPELVRSRALRPETVRSTIASVLAASTRTPTTAVAAYLESRALQLAGRHQLALESASLAAREDPDAPEPRQLIADLLLALDRPGDAEAELARLIAQRCPGSELAWRAWWRLATRDGDPASTLLKRLACPGAASGPPRVFATNGGRRLVDTLRRLLADLDAKGVTSVPLSGEFAISPTRWLVPVPAGRYELSFTGRDRTPVALERIVEGEAIRAAREGFLELVSRGGKLPEQGLLLSIKRIAGG